MKRNHKIRTEGNKGERMEELNKRKKETNKQTNKETKKENHDTWCMPCDIRLVYIQFIANLVFISKSVSRARF